MITENHKTFNIKSRLHVQSARSLIYIKYQLLRGTTFRQGTTVEAPRIEQ